ncbi:MAG: IclR family transcriptional regulator [Bacteroidota bacterium]
MKVSQVDNVLALFELFAREKAPRTLTAVAQQLGMPKSSTFNLIHTLLERGFLYETRRRGGYYPTRRLLDLATRIAEGDPFLQSIHGTLESLAAETGETVLLAVREHQDVTYVDVVESSSAIRSSAKVGDRRPLHTASSGKAILAALEPKERATVLSALEGAGRGVSEAALGVEIETTQRRGWSEDRAKTAPDVMGIGVPLVCGERRFGLAVAGPIYRMDGRRRELAAALQRAAEDIRTDFARGAAPAGSAGAETPK